MSPRIGLALSGGGFRATCFGLGCLRALADRDLLRHVKVISGISGGSLLTAMYAYGPEHFAEFDRSVIEVLSDGLQLAVLARAVQPPVILRNLRHASLVAGRRRNHTVMRGANRTDALRDVLAGRLFSDRPMSDVTHPSLDTVITATDLRTSTAMRFGSARSSNWRHGVVVDTIPVAEAVAASAAFPLLLPAVERRYRFRIGTAIDVTEHTLHLTDGGVYDNLGLSVLEPGRSPEYTAQVYDVDYIVACDAGPGQPRVATGHFVAARLKNSFDIVHRRAQNAARAKLHEDRAAGKLRGFVHVYLGMDDNRLPVPVADLVPVRAVSGYPTSFAAMAPTAREDISLRAEQLTAGLLDRWCPDLMLG